MSSAIGSANEPSILIFSDFISESTGVVDVSMNSAMGFSSFKTKSSDNSFL